MPLILPSNSISAVGYEVDNSLRFDDGSSDSLTRTPASAGNRKTFTISAWVKRSTLSYDYSYIFTAGTYTSTQMAQFKFDSNDQLNISGYASGGSQEFRVLTNQRFRDVSAWYHLVASVDTTQGTASNRVKLYINGTLYSGGFVEASYPSLNYDSAFNSNIIHSFGIRNGTSTYYDGYMAEAVLIDGTALDPTSFGEFDEDTGIWKPIDVSELTFGTNGFYLPFENSAALGQDDSGNGNNFTVNNLTSIDQTTDTPTNNFATFNPLFPNSGLTFSNGNLGVVANDANYRHCVSTLGASSGKYYAEFKAVSGFSSVDKNVGIYRTDNNYSATTGLGNYTTGTTWSYGANGLVRTNNGTNDTEATFTDGDIISVAMDLDNNKLYFAKNGTWINSGDPTSGATGTGAYTIISNGEPYHFGATSISSGGAGLWQANFGSPPFTISSGNSDGNGYGNFEYTVPSGYYSLNTKNLAEFG